MNILVDSSVWIDYFRGGKNSVRLDQFIEENLICINDLILAEIIPPLRLKNQNKLIELLNEISRIPLNINWSKIIQYQTICLKNGINKIGIPDFIIIDHVYENNIILFSLDKHFHLISNYINLKLVELISMANH